jgi:hypothetical protein
VPTPMNRPKRAAATVNSVIFIFSVYRTVRGGATLDVGRSTSRMSLLRRANNSFLQTAFMLSVFSVIQGV